MHVDDLADACFFLLQEYNESEIINIGSGKESSIKELAEFISYELKYSGTLIFDKTKQDGTPRKLLDSSKINLLGWGPKIKFQEGINNTVNEFLESRYFK